MSLSQQQLGFHYYPDTDHYGQEDIDTWLPVLKSAGASWLTLRATSSKPIPDTFLHNLTENAIQPIVHLVDLVGTLRLSQVYTHLKRYADAGVRYVVCYDRPNMRIAWPQSTWTHDSLVSRFVEITLPILEAQVELGLTPMFPPLEPGGDYWDTAFLETALALLQQRLPDTVQQHLALSLYMWTFGKALDWGSGGQAAWPDARPYRTIVGCQDQRGFQIHEWYQQIAERVLGKRVPLIVVAGGAGPSQTYASPKALQLANNDVASFLATNTLPDAMVNFNFYPLATAENHKDSPGAWYVRPEAKTVVECCPEEVLADEPAQKPFKHYVLLGLGEHTNGLDLWKAIAPPIMSARATVGFSLEEARQAARVSIVGDYTAIPASYEKELASSGIAIERFENWNTDAFLLAASSWAVNSEGTGVEHV